jgi:hypothetical protein
MKNENILFFFHSELDLLDKFVLVGLAVLFLCIDGRTSLSQTR